MAQSERTPEAQGSQASLRCPNVIPGYVCIDPECTYCRISREEGAVIKRPEDPN